MSPLHNCFPFLPLHCGKRQNSLTLLAALQESSFTQCPICGSHIAKAFLDIHVNQCAENLCTGTNKQPAADLDRSQEGDKNASLWDAASCRGPSLNPEDISVGTASNTNTQQVDHECTTVLNETAVAPDETQSNVQAAAGQWRSPQQQPSDSNQTQETATPSTSAANAFSIMMQKQKEMQPKVSFG